MEESIPIELRSARRRRPPNTSILTAGLDVEFPPTPPLRLAAAAEEVPPPPPPPEEPEKPEPKPEPPKPEKPEEPKPPPVDCEAISRGLDEVNDEIEAIRAEENAVRREIRNLEDEISQLRGEQSADSFFSIDRPPKSPDGRRPTRGLGLAVRIGSRLLPIISGIMAAQGAIETFDRTQALALANQQLAVLTAKLKEILRRERQKLDTRLTLEQRFDKYCRGGSRPSNPDP